MPELSSDQLIRCAALDAASRYAEPGTATGGILSRASQCETYLRTGIARSGPNWRGAVEVGGEGVSVLVADDRMDPRKAAMARNAVVEALREIGLPA